jgi:hypothetical protein
MARSRPPATPVPVPGPPALLRAHAEVAPQLQERITLGKELQERRDAPTYRRDAIKWSECNSTLLDTVFTTNVIASEYKSAAFGMFLNSGDTGNSNLFADGVDQQIQKLESKNWSLL